MPSQPWRLAAALVAACCLGAAGCGSDSDSDSGSDSAAERPAAAAPDLAPVKAFLLDHTERLSQHTDKLRAQAEEYYKLAEAADFDYAELLATRRADVRRFVKDAQATFAKANPDYEEMEGVVAGVPSLADYDVSIDAGSDGSDPESAVPFSLKTPAGKVYKQPGNYNYLIETSVFGTDPKWAAKGVKPDLDGDGKVEFGEAMPDADFYVTAARDMDSTVKDLDASARKWKPNAQDAFTALVVMTPTMSEYFEAWKNSRFVAGAKAKEKAFVVASRLQDIADILGGLETVYAGVAPQIASVDDAQAAQTRRELRSLTAFAERLRDAEAGGRRFTAEEAETLGTDAQARAEAIAGQVSQAAGRLGIDLEA